MAFAEVQGVRLWYEDSGGNGPAVVLVHGAAGSSENWFRQRPALEAAGFRCISWDLRNAGKSEAPPGMAGEGSVAGDLEGLLDVLGLDEVCLVAQAAGGFGAFEFAVESPRRVRALVVANSFGGITDPEYQQRRRELAPEGVSSWPREERELGRSYRAVNPEGVRLFVEMEHRGRPDDPAQRQKPRRPMTLSLLETLSMPVLLIAADEDVLSQPALMRMMADRIPGCRFEVIAGAGHCSYWERPDEWNRLVIGFLRSVLK